ncbi:MAG: hypothetical protein AAF843_15355 [Bacteroidota bacterium]
MERRDVLKDQIEQLGRVLGKMIAKLLKLKDHEISPSALNDLEQELQDELDLNIDDLLALNDQAVENFLKERKFHWSHFIALSEYLHEAGQIVRGEDAVKAHLYFEKALALLELTDQVTKTISLEREIKKLKSFTRIVEIYHYNHLIL